jgi:glycosylphosphatidylinositol transamidase (GPIT) subunit GPI8
LEAKKQLIGRFKKKRYLSDNSTSKSNSILIKYLSGPNDNIFVFFSDHGAPGLIAFPEGTLHASDLNKAIKSMYTHKKYKNVNNIVTYNKIILQKY